MPLPVLFIGAAALTGTAGVGKTLKAGFDLNQSKKLNISAEELINESKEALEEERTKVSETLKHLGELKLFIFEHSITSFLDTFTQIKNVDFRETEGLDELKNLVVDEQVILELKEMAGVVHSIAGGAVAGVAGGALTAIGAYGAATCFATASTGTAISALSGIAAQNATLAFFGGGSLATGGLGIAGGTMVLGGLVAGPALLVLGFTVGAHAEKQLEIAKTNLAEAEEYAKQLEAASLQCVFIRRRTYMIYNLLTRLDAYLTQLVFDLEDVVKSEGVDYKAYASSSKKTVAKAASVAVCIKSVLDTAILTEEGNVTDESETVINKYNQMLEHKE